MLVAEDEPVLLGLLVELLAEEGYAVLAARDGAEALALAAPPPPQGTEGKRRGGQDGEAPSR